MQVKCKISTRRLRGERGKSAGTVQLKDNLREKRGNSAGYLRENRDQRAGKLQVKFE